MVIAIKKKKLEMMMKLSQFVEKLTCENMMKIKQLKEKTI